MNLAISVSTPIPAFASAIPPPPPVVVNLDCTDLVAALKRSVLDLEDLDPSQKPLGTVRVRSSTPSTGTSVQRFHPYVNTRQRSKAGESSNSSKTRTAQSKGKNRAVSSPLSSVPSSPEPGSPSPLHKSPSTSDGLVYGIQVLIPRPKDASRQNLEKLLAWKPDEYKHFRVPLSYKPLFDIFLTGLSYRPQLLSTARKNSTPPNHMCSKIPRSWR